MKKLLSLLVVAMVVGSFSVCQAEELEESYDLERIPKIPAPEVPVEIEPSVVVGSITLTTGWNLIAIPVLPYEPYTVERFIKEVNSRIKPIPIDIEKSLAATFEGERAGTLEEEGARIEEKDGEKCIVYPRSYWDIPVVAVYKNGRFERYPKEGVTYNMVPGEAYFVYARYTGPWLKMVGWRPKTTVYIKGRPLNVPVSLNLNRGWNGVSILEKLGMGIDRLSKELTEQNIKAARIAFWSAQKQEWEQHELPWQPEPKGDVIMIPVIPADCGFFLLSNENGLYIPSLNMKPEPPVPPFPPKPPVIVDERVSYRGKVKGICSIPEERLPYNFVLSTDTADSIPLKGVDDEIEERLEKAADGEYECIVSGYFKPMTYTIYRPPMKKTVKVLVVDTVKCINDRIIEHIYDKFTFEER